MDEEERNQDRLVESEDILQEPDGTEQVSVQYMQEPSSEDVPVEVSAVPENTYAGHHHPDEGYDSGATERGNMAQLSQAAVPEQKRPLFARVFRGQHAVRNAIIASVAIILLAGSGTTGYVLTRQQAKDSSPIASSEPTPSPTPTIDTALVEDAAPSPTPTPADTPAVLSDALTLVDSVIPETTHKLFKNTEYFGRACTEPNQSDASQCPLAVDVNQIKYFKVGTLNDGSVAYVAIVPVGGIDVSNQVLYSVKNDSYTLYLRQSGMYYLVTNDETSRTKLTNDITGNPKLDEATAFSALVFPKELTAGGQKVKWESADSTDSMPIYLADGTANLTGHGISDFADQVKVIGKNKEFTYYAAVVMDDPSYQVLSYFVVKNNIFSYGYYLNGELTSSTEPVAIAWDAGGTNSVGYGLASRGCGYFNGFMVPKNITKAELIKIGKTPKGQPVYQLPDSNDLMKELYEKDYVTGEWLQDDSLKNLSYDQFKEKHAAIVLEDGNNYLLAMVRGDMFVRGGCAKPVVYLYPATPQVVDVRVGADVTVSEPLYGLDGWQNVLAWPDGRLDYQGSTYRSLFWEGIGHGEYPTTQGVGVVVPAHDAAATIRSQLAAQGLNTEESDDFMEFWEPQLPTTGYVRLTWLQTAQMNKLAPLDITPQPTTQIRVFLEFEPLDHYELLAPQIFVSPVRSGFTVVEWGGLAVHGLDSVAQFR